MREALLLRQEHPRRTTPRPVQVLLCLDSKSGGSGSPAPEDDGLVRCLSPGKLQTGQDSHSQADEGLDLD